MDVASTLTSGAACDGRRLATRWVCTDCVATTLDFSVGADGLSVRHCRGRAQMPIPIQAQRTTVDSATRRTAPTTDSANHRRSAIGRRVAVGADSTGADSIGADSMCADSIGAFGSGSIAGFPGAVSKGGAFRNAAPADGTSAVIAERGVRVAAACLIIMRPTSPVRSEFAGSSRRPVIHVVRLGRRAVRPRYPARRRAVPRPACSRPGVEPGAAIRLRRRLSLVSPLPRSDSSCSRTRIRTSPRAPLAAMCFRGPAEMRLPAAADRGLGRLRSPCGGLRSSMCLTRA